jgi:transcriptional regulator with XRE-family HTH domain
MVAMGRGCGKTPESVVELIRKKVDEVGQNATAKAIGIPLRSVQKYLKGESEPTSATLKKIADYFRVEVWQLRGEKYVFDRITELQADVYISYAYDLIKVLQIIPNELQGSVKFALMSIADSIGNIFESRINYLDEDKIGKLKKVCSDIAKSAF